jgi:hypothetical protein
MESFLHGRLRNTSISTTNGLIPLLEAVVNSIQAIDERGIPPEDGRIEIEVLRDTAQQELDIDKRRRGPEAEAEIDAFRITDNGVGFDRANTASFATLDSEHKAKLGCRGVGRLAWLKAFKSVSVRSVFTGDSGQLEEKSFSFDSRRGVFNERPERSPDELRQLTTIQLDGFLPAFRSNARKTSNAIALAIVEHCLWYFLREGGAPQMFLVDNGIQVSLEEIFKAHMYASATKDKLTYKKEKFELLHVRLRSNSIGGHSIAWCAANRVVDEEHIGGKIPGLHGKLSDGSGSFWYSCYVSSPYLDERSRPEREAFNIRERSEGILQEVEISMEDLREQVLKRAQLHLGELLQENVKSAKERVSTFVSKKAPRYGPILSRIPSDRLDIDPSTSDKDLELLLHRQLAEIEVELLKEGQEIMAPKSSESPTEYRARVSAYLEKVDDVKKSDLASYVSHRKVILDLLEAALRKNEDGRYSREELIHSLIMPMRADSTEIHADSCNFWVIDERLAFHDYLASDKTLASMPITDSLETKEPDLLALNVFDTPILVSEGEKMPLASLVVVEFKRPMRNDAGPGKIDDPIEQALGYLERIRLGKIQTRSGRPIPGAENVPGFVYVVCDLTASIEQRCRLHDMTRSADGLGYFDYKSQYKAYIEVLSFDGLLKAARQRNRAFFDKLGLPC